VKSIRDIDAGSLARHVPLPETGNGRFPVESAA
jgi:hypothetical protein